VAVAVALGEDFSTAAGRLDGVVLSPWRMDVQERSVPGGTVVVVNDAYNANPTSMRSALETVAGMPGHHVAVLGMMHELGGSAAELHEEVGSLASALGFDVVVVGEDPGIARGAGSGAISVPGVAEARDALADLIRPGDVVLVKASRAAGLEAIPDLIGEEAA
jgi:UDP-N-acetylmuramoyl-tripeptide--D-alanyl-D-alanine ligase